MNSLTSGTYEWGFVTAGCLVKPSLSFLRQSRQTAPDVNTEPSQNEQIIWDDPTAREERARLASNLQWPSCPTQYSEPQVDIKKLEDSPFQDPLHDLKIVEPGNEKEIYLLLCIKYLLTS